MDMDTDTLFRNTSAVVGAHGHERTPAAVTEHGRLAAEVIRLRAREREARREAAMWAEEAREAARSKQDMLDILGDELRNPLAVMTLSVRRLTIRAQGHPDPICETLARQVDRLTGLVNELLDAARAGSDRVAIDRQRVEVHTVVSAAVDEVFPAASRPPNLEVDVPSTGLAVLADRALLQQALAQALGNARKFASPGRPGHIRVYAAAAEREAVIRLIDDGSGVARDKLSSIFEPFVQGFPLHSRAVRGLGLGLTIVRSVVELHGGSVRASSPGPGGGFEIEIRLPLAPFHLSAVGRHMK